MRTITYHGVWRLPYVSAVSHLGYVWLFSVVQGYVWQRTGPVFVNPKKKFTLKYFNFLYSLNHFFNIFFFSFMLLTLIIFSTQTFFTKFPFSLHVCYLERPSDAMHWVAWSWQRIFRFYFVWTYWLCPICLNPYQNRLNLTVFSHETVYVLLYRTINNLIHSMWILLYLLGWCWLSVHFTIACEIVTSVPHTNWRKAYGK